MPDYIVFIIYILSFQGILTSLILIAKRNVRTTSNLFLVLFLLSFSLFLLGENLYWGTFYVHNPHFIFGVVAFPLLFGPLLYFYVAPRKKLLVVLLHFIPFLLLVAHHLPFYLNTASEKTTFLYENIRTPNVNAKFFIYRIIVVIQVVIYFYLIRRLIRKDSPVKKHKWYTIVNILYAGFGIIYIAQMLVFGFMEKINVIGIYFSVFMILMAIFILFFISKIILVPELFKANSKYIRSQLPNDQKEHYAELIIASMENEHIFLNKELRLIDLAHNINLTEHQLSQLLSEHFQMNFFEFINSYRINTAKKLILDPSYGQFTIDAIGQEVGFKSKSSFYEAFKKFVGSTPSSFKKEHTQ